MGRSAREGIGDRGREVRSTVKFHFTAPLPPAIEGEEGREEVRRRGLGS